jgi:hypothetical protein
MFEVLEAVGALMELLELADALGRLIHGGARLAARLLGRAPG